MWVSESGALARDGRWGPSWYSNGELKPPILNSSSTQRTTPRLLLHY